MSGGWHTSSTMEGRAFNIGASDGATVALVLGPHNGGPDEFVTNASLMAAAPELLVALKSLCDADASYVASKIHIDCDSHGDAIRRMRIAREAIAKAEGRS